MGNCNYGYTVKPYHAVHLNQAVTCIKRSPFLVLSWKSSYELNLFYEVTCLEIPRVLCPRVTSLYRLDCRDVMVQKNIVNVILTL